jgi:hypothetical protein
MPLRFGQGEIEDLEGDLEGLRRERTRIDREIKSKQVILKEMKVLQALQDGVDPRQIAGTSMSVREAACAYLVDRGTACHYMEILQALEERGVHVGGKNPGVNLLTQIKRDNRIVRVSKGVYGVRECPSP